MFGRRGSAKAFLRLVSQLPFMEEGRLCSSSPVNHSEAGDHSSVCGRVVYGSNANTGTKPPSRTVLSTRFFQGGFSSVDATSGADSAPAEDVRRGHYQRAASGTDGVGRGHSTRVSAGVSGTVRWAVAWSYRGDLNAQAVADVEDRVR